MTTTTDEDGDYEFAKVPTVPTGTTTVAVQLPSASDTSTANYTGANELLLVAVETNVAEDTGYGEHVTLTLQLRHQ